MTERPDVLFFGLSATPWSRGMGDIWDDLIVPTTLSELIELGWLCKFRVFASHERPDLSKIKIVAGEYHEGQLSEVMSSKKITADVVSTWLEKGENRQTICFAVNRAHAATIHEQFEAAGVGSAYVDGETPREERQAILERYKRGEVKIINSIGTMTTGVDIPCQCLIMARPTKSEILFIQMFGRGLRTEDGKANMTLLDHAGNCQRLGMPTSIGRTTLRSAATDAKEAEKSEAQRTEPLPRECGSCHALLPAKTRVCPSCGSEMRRASDVEVVDGELVEFGSAPAKGGKKSAIDRLRDQGKQAIYSQLWAEGKGEKFVLAKYKAIFDTWPRNLVRMPLEPSVELRSWLHSERIRWAAAQAKFKKTGSATADDARGLVDAS
jgi:superfamily II DNA or RNA helicase